MPTKGGGGQTYGMNHFCKYNFVLRVLILNLVSTVLLLNPIQHKRYPDDIDWVQNRTLNKDSIGECDPLHTFDFSVIHTIARWFLFRSRMTVLECHLSISEIKKYGNKSPGIMHYFLGRISLKSVNVCKLLNFKIIRSILGPFSIWPLMTGHLWFWMFC